MNNHQRFLSNYPGGVQTSASQQQEKRVHKSNQVSLSKSLALSTRFWASETRFWTLALCTLKTADKRALLSQKRAFLSQKCALLSVMSAFLSVMNAFMSVMSYIYSYDIYSYDSYDSSCSHTRLLTFSHRQPYITAPNQKRALTPESPSPSHLRRCPSIHC